MSASLSPKPSDLLLLGAFGLAAYWAMTHQARAAAPAAPAQGSNDASKVQAANALGGLLGGIARLFGGGGSTVGSGGGFVGEGPPSGIPQWDQALQRAVSWTAAGGYGESRTGGGDSGASGLPSLWPDFGSSTGGNGAWL